MVLDVPKPTVKLVDRRWRGALAGSKVSYARCVWTVPSRASRLNSLPSSRWGVRQVLLYARWNYSPPVIRIGVGSLISAK